MFHLLANEIIYSDNWRTITQLNIKPMLYIGNKKTKQLHTESCVYAKKIKSSNRVEFESIQDAFDAGYFGCGHCLENYDEKNVRKFDDGYEQWLEQMKVDKDKQKPVFDADDWCLIAESGESGDEEKDATAEIEECYLKHNSELGAITSSNVSCKNRYGVEGKYNVYKHGYIFWTDELGAYAVTGLVLDQYQKEGGVGGEYGFPISDLIETNTDGVKVALFENGAFFVDKNRKVFALPEGILKQYISLNADKGALGVPCSGICTVENGFFVSFHKNKDDDGRIYSISDKNGLSDVFAIYGELLSQYKTKSSYLGVPVSGEESYPMREIVGTVTDITRICYYWKKTSFTKGVIYNKNGKYCPLYGPIWERYSKIEGEQNKYFAPVSGIEKRPTSIVEYADFSGGVIACAGDQVVDLSTVELYLERAVSDKISDGRDPNTLWTTYDVNAELVAYLTIMYNGAPVTRYTEKDGMAKYDDYRLNSHSGSTYEINRRFKFTIRNHDDSFSFKVRYKDWDATNSNDPLGSISKIFFIDNLWGFGLANKDGIFFEQPLTDGYTSSSSSLRKENTVLTTYSVNSPVEVVANPEAFMPECWWAFHNYGRNKDYSYNFFCSVFKDMHRVDDGDWTWFADTLAHPSDHLFWSVNKNSGRGGLCFGMSLLALKAIKSESIFSLPLNRYRMTNLSYETETRHFEYPDATNEALRESINRYHLYQNGKAIHDWKLKLIMDGTSYSPKKFFKSLKECMDKEKFCVVGVHPSGKGGHALLAYRCEEVSDSEWRVYLADPNKAADPAENGPTIYSTHSDEVYFKINPKKNTSEIVAPGKMYADENYYKTNGFDMPLAGMAGYISSWMAIGNSALYYIPYSLCSKQPRTVNWIVEVLKGVFHLIFGGPVDPYKFSIFFTFGDCADVKMEDGAECFEMPLFFGDGFSRMIVVKDASHFKTRLVGKKAGVMRCAMLNRMRAIDMSVPVGKGEEDTILLENTNPKRPSLSLMTTKTTPKKIDVSIKCHDHRRKERLSVDLKLSAGNQAESKIEFGRYLKDLSISQGGLKRGVSMLRKVETPLKVEKNVARVSARTQPVRFRVKQK